MLLEWLINNTMPKEPSEQKNTPLAGVGRWRFFCSREGPLWRAQEGYVGADAVQSQELVDWDLTKGFKTHKQLSNDSRAEKNSKPVANIVGSF